MLSIKPLKSLNSVLFILIAILSAIIFKKSFYTPLTEPKYLIVHFVIPLFFILLFLFAIKRPQTFKLKTLAIFTFFILALFLVQTGFVVAKVVDKNLTRRRTSWQHMKAAWKEGKKFDSRTPLEVVKELRSKGETVYSTLPNSLFWHSDYDIEQVQLNGKPILPLGGVSLVKTVYCNETGDYLIYQSDEHGFNNPLGLYNTPLTILAVGDSMTHGACVPSDDNAVARIRRQYPKTLNLGYGDNGPLPNLATLAEYGPELKPKIVLWFYYEGNDIDGLQLERQSPLLTQYLEPLFRQGIPRLRNFLDGEMRKIGDKRFAGAPMHHKPLLSELDWKNFSSLAQGFLSLRPLRTSFNLIPPMPSLREPAEHFTNPHLELLIETWKKARVWTESWNGKLIVVYLPEWNNFSIPDFIRYDRKDVLHALDGLQIPVIDILPVFHAHPDPLSLFPFRAYGHYTSEGFKLVATQVLDYFKSSMLDYLKNSGIRTPTQSEDSAGLSF